MYRLEHIPDKWAEQYYPKIFNDYLARKKSLTPLYRLYPTEKNLISAAAARTKSFPEQSRSVLCEALCQQYTHLPEIPEAVQENLSRLRLGSTVTITTGQQPVLFLGPLYILYKIVTTIVTAKWLSEEHPQFHFVPIYWIAEDHGPEKVTHSTLFGKEYVWDNEAHRLTLLSALPTQGIAPLLNQMPVDFPFFREGYTTSRTLAEATRYTLNHLFGKEGLVVLDPNERSLKYSFRGIMGDQLRNYGEPLRAHVQSTRRRLREMNYTSAKGVGLRPPCNLWYYGGDYMRGSIRGESEDTYLLASCVSVFREDLHEAVEKHPEAFSPNVLLRTLYQEHILPNVAYVGGPSEITYWLHMKSAFAAYDIPFPLLVPRFRGLMLFGRASRMFEKHQIDPELLFLPKEAISKAFLQRRGEDLKAEKEQWKDLWRAIERKAGAHDTALSAHLHTRGKEIDRLLHDMEKKMRSAKEKKVSTQIRACEKVHEMAFPGGKLQERAESFLTAYALDPRCIPHLMEQIKPLNFSFSLLLQKQQEDRGKV